MSELENFATLCENERKQANPCAWCDNEKGVERKTDDTKVSHGICERHSDEILQRVYENLYAELARDWGYMI